MTTLTRVHKQAWLALPLTLVVAGLTACSGDGSLADAARSKASEVASAAESLRSQASPSVALPTAPALTPSPSVALPTASLPSRTPPSPTLTRTESPTEPEESTPEETTSSPPATTTEPAPTTSSPTSEPTESATTSSPPVEPSETVTSAEVLPPTPSPDSSLVAGEASGEPSSGGVPAWVWILLALVVLAALVGWLLSRRDGDDEAIDAIDDADGSQARGSHHRPPTDDPEQ